MERVGEGEGCPPRESIAKAISPGPRDQRSSSSCLQGTGGQGCGLVSRRQPELLAEGGAQYHSQGCARLIKAVSRLTEIRTLSHGGGTQEGQGGLWGWPSSGKPEFATGHRYCRSGYRWNRGQAPDVAASRPTIETETVIRSVLQGFTIRIIKHQGC